MTGSHVHGHLKMIGFTELNAQSLLRKLHNANKQDNLIHLLQTESDQEEK